MKKTILTHLQKMEFVCGLKQFKEYKEEDAKEILECLYKLFVSYGWMNESRVDYILHAGMRGQYGDFYHVNEKTVNGWISQYYAHHQSQIVQEVQALNNQEKEASPEEIAYWIEIGKQIFRDNYEHAKETGYCKDLAEWGINWFYKFQEKGILKPWEFPVEDIETGVRRELRLSSKWIDESSVSAKSKNRLWKMFILESIKEKRNLDKLI
jgi:NADH:ubiquinone oxidoreductase subunit E